MLIILFIISQWVSFLRSTDIYDMADYGDSLLISTNGGALIFSGTNFIPITNVDGLSTNDVRQVEIDKYGNWWFLCRDGGITLMSSNRLRSKNFTYMDGLPSYNFSSLFIDGDTVWVGTDDATKVWMYDMNGDPFKNGNVLLLDIKPTNEVKTIVIIGDSIWFGTTKGIGVTCKGGTSFIVYDMDDGLPNDTVLAIADWSGYIWAGTHKGVARRISSGWEIVDPSAEKVNGFGFNTISFWEVTSSGVKKWEGFGFSPIPDYGWDSRVCLIDSNSTLWIGSWGSGLVKYASGSLIYYIPSGPQANKFSSLAVDLKGNLWAGHDIHQVSNLYYDGTHRNWEWKIYNENNEWGIVDGWSSKVIADKKNNIWVGMWASSNLGLVKIMPNDSILKIKIEGAPIANCISSLCTDAQDNLWIACHDGRIRRIRNDTVDTIINYTGSLTFPIIGVNSEGDLWAGERAEGLVVFLSQGGISRIPDFPMDEIKFISMGTSANEVWVGTLTKGIYKIKDRKIVLSYTSDETGGIVNDMTIDVKGNIWFAVSEAGIKKLEPDGSFTTYNKSDGLASDDVTKIRAYQDILWIGTNYGLSRFDIGSVSPTLTQVKVYPNPFILSKHTHISFDSKDLKGSKISIYTLSGRLIKTIEWIESSFASWDARNIQGELVGSGVYIFVIHTSGGAKKVGKIAVVR